MSFYHYHLQQHTITWVYFGEHLMCMVNKIKTLVEDHPRRSNFLGGSSREEQSKSKQNTVYKYTRKFTTVEQLKR